MVLIQMPASRARLQRGIAHEVNIVGVGERELGDAIRGNGDVSSARSAQIVGARAGKKSRLGIADFTGRTCAAKECLPERRQFHVVARVVKRSIEHDAHTRSVGGGGKCLKLGQRLCAPSGRVILSGRRIRRRHKGARHERHHLEEILHCVGRAHLKRLARDRVGLPPIHPVRVDRLEPQHICAEILHVLQAEARPAAHAAGEIGKSAALRGERASGGDRERVHFVELHIARSSRRDDDAAVALVFSIRADFGIVVAIGARRIANQPIARRFFAQQA